MAAFNPDDKKTWSADKLSKVGTLELFELIFTKEEVYINTSLRNLNHRYTFKKIGDFYRIKRSLRNLMIGVDVPSDLPPARRMILNETIKSFMEIGSDISKAEHEENEKSYCLELDRELTKLTKKFITLYQIPD